MADASGLNSIEISEHISPEATGDDIGAKRVLPYSYDNATAKHFRNGLARTEMYDYSSSTAIYAGEATLGTAVSATGWTITKYDLSSSSAASGKVATDVSWNNRASGTYN